MIDRNKAAAACQASGLQLSLNVTKPDGLKIVNDNIVAQL